MARCFCGCGRKIAFSRRPINTSGKRVSKELAAWELRNRIIREQAPETSRRNIETFIADGVGLRDSLVEIVHGEADPSTFDADTMRAWLQFSRKTRRELGV